MDHLMSYDIAHAKLSRDYREQVSLSLSVSLGRVIQRTLTSGWCVCGSSVMCTYREQIYIYINKIYEVCDTHVRICVACAYMCR